MTIGSRLRAARQEARMTLRQLASLVGCSASALNLYETGARKPSAARLAEIANALGCSLWDVAPTQELHEMLEETNTVYSALPDSVPEDVHETVAKAVEQAATAAPELREFDPSTDHAVYTYRILLAAAYLNDEGMRRLTEYAEDLAQISRYQIEKCEIYAESVKNSSGDEGR